MRQFSSRLGVCIAVLGFQSTGADAAADLILRNGRIYTVNGTSAVVDAVAIEKGRIVALGTSVAEKKWQSPATQVVDLRGRAAYPGFIDSHAHLLALGVGKLNVELEGTQDFEEIVERARKAADAQPPGTWILGAGWHESKWRRAPAVLVRGFPTHQALTAAVPHHPVVFVRADGHALIANARAMELMGINASTTTPAGGEIIHDAQGQPTGIFVDGAMPLIKTPEPSEDIKRKAWKLAFDECLKSGVTSVDEAGLRFDDIQLIKKIAAEGRLPIRLYAMLEGLETLQKFERPEIARAGGFLTIRAVKLYVDGALGSRGALMLAPYNDDPANSGLLLTPEDDLRKAMSYSLERGFQVNTHAIGDRGNRMVLDLYEEAFARERTRKDLRWRIEHAQILDEADIPRFGRLGVIASMQTVHAPSDLPWTTDRIGAERVKEGAYVWRKLLASGAHIANGTDVPVESLDPIRNFYAAVTRRDINDQPPGGFSPDQSMTREEALRSYTIEGAYATFTEKEAGSIEVGKNADIVVLSSDIMQVPEKEILEARAVMTIVAGKVLWEAKS